MIPSWRAMSRDLAGFSFGTMSVKEKVTTWINFYWWPTRRWAPRIGMWWGYNVLGWPKPPPFEKDRIALHFGFVDGVPPCTDGPICAEHGWKLSPLVTDEETTDG